MGNIADDVVLQCLDTAEVWAWIWPREPDRFLGEGPDCGRKREGWWECVYCSFFLMKLADKHKDI